MPSKRLKMTTSFIEWLHFIEYWVLWRTFSFGKWRVNVFKTNHAFEEFEDDHEFQRRLYFREDFISENIGYSGDRFHLGNEEWMYSKPTTPLKSSKMTTSFREDFISEKTSFQRRLGTLENVFDREMNSECIQNQPHLPRVPKTTTKFQKRLHFREDFISEKIGYSGEHIRSGNEEWLKVNMAINPFRATFFFFCEEGSLRILVLIDVLRSPVVYKGTGSKGKSWNVCNFSSFTPTGGTSGLNTSATTKIVPVLVLLWTNFCNQVI